MYYRPDTGEKFQTHSEIRASFSSGDIVVLFLDVITDEDLTDRGVFPLANATEPYTEPDQIAVALEPELVDGVWTQMWNVRAATQEELDARAAAAKALVPQQVTRRQARQALLLNGLLDQVPEKIATISDATERGLAQIEWEDSQVFERNRPLLISIGTAIGLDSDGLDALFVQAAGL
jgi:hypothetical protein